MIKLTNKFYGASLVALAFSLSSADVNAQTCTTAPSCDTLGFTKSSSECSGKTSLKCPFDMSKFFCLDAGEGGNTSGQSYCGSPEVGGILYSDMNCASASSSVDKSKTPIGIIFDAQRRLAVALDESALSWLSMGISLDVPNLPNYSLSDARSDFMGKSNTTIIWEYCQVKEKKCPLFEYVSNYKTVGTNVGDWYLPALGELNVLFDNREYVRSALSKVSGVDLCSKCQAYEADYWSSSTFDSVKSVSKNFVNSTEGASGKYESYNVRPVLAF